MEIKTYKISELNLAIKEVLEGKFGFVSVIGEVSGFKESSSGHLYFNLKDESSMINIICFKGNADKIDFKIEDGMEIIISGKLTIYQERSSYQIIATKITLSGVGALLAIIEKRKAKLMAEGLFDARHKKPLPFLPRKIAVITSDKGAVINDIKHRISDRFPMELLIYSSLMQGKNAALEVSRGIRFINQNLSNEVDLIIIARGGGSVEDLMPFNDEDLVREVFASKIPVISAIGHETDFTLLDFVSDLRVPTPSAAAEIAVPSRSDLNDKLNAKIILVKSKIRRIFVANKNRLEIATNFIKRNKFEIYLKNIDVIMNKISFMAHGKLHSSKNKLEILRIPALVINNIQNQEIRLNAVSRIIKSYNYQTVLNRGFTMVKSGGKVLKSIDEIPLSKMIEINMSDGVCVVKNFDIENLRKW